MTAERRESRAAATAASLGAAAMIAQQVAGKATRDALFLTHFRVEVLPWMFVATAVVSVVAMAAMVRLLGRYGPARVVPAAFGVSAAALAGVAACASVAPAVASVLLYLHVGSVGAALISGFWSVVNERFEPRAARRTVGRIAVGGTVGGSLGGLFALASASTLSAPVMLGFLALANLACVALLRRVRSGAAVGVGTRGPSRPGSLRAGARVLRSDGYLAAIAGLVLAASCAEALVDWVFKAEAQARFGGGPALMRFFAVFYTAVGLSTFGFQLAIGRRWLERFGPLAAVVGLPACIAAVGGAALALPSLAAAAAARATDAVLRSSLYRSGYELLYVPVAPERKRTTKTLVDVGVDRLGNLTGGLLVSVVLALGFAVPGRVLLGVAVAVSGLGVVLALRLRRGYTRALETSMLDRALELQLGGVSDDEELRSTLVFTLADLDLKRALHEGDADGDEAQPSGRDPIVDALVSLRSGDANRVREVLHRRLAPELIPHVVPLLAWDAVAAAATDALRARADAATGHLVDALLSPESDFAVRRRLPHVLAAASTQRAVDGLLRALSDPRFEVRAQSARALAFVLGANPRLSLERDRVLEAAAVEVSVEHAVWRSHRLVDATTLPSALGRMPGDDTHASNDALRHVFCLLWLVQPEDALTTAFHALRSGDSRLYGTAIEYLQSALPARVHRGLVRLVEAAPPSERGAETDEHSFGQRTTIDDPGAATNRSVESRSPNEAVPAAPRVSGDDESSELGEQIGTSISGRCLTGPLAGDRTGPSREPFAE